MTNISFLKLVIPIFVLITVGAVYTVWKTWKGGEDNNGGRGESVDGQELETYISLPQALTVESSSPKESETTEVDTSVEEPSQRLNATTESDFIIVKDTNTNREIYRIPERAYTEFSKTRGNHREEGSVIYAIVNEKLRRLYVFVSIPEDSGATGNIVGNIVESDLNGEHMILFFRRWEGKKLTHFKFSPEGRFLSYKTLWGGGAGIYSSSIAVVGIDSKRMYNIEPPRDRDECIEQAGTQWPEGVNAGIGSYRWVDEATIELTFFCWSSLGKVSSDETWQYSFQSGEYKLIKSEGP